MHRPHLDFTLALHQQLPSRGNLCWSPYSVAAALGTAAAGARGATRDQLAAALAPGGDLAGLGQVLADSATLREAETAVANSLWMDRRLRFREDYRQAVLALPGGAAYSSDFRGDPEGSRRTINDDVARTTRGLIQELLAQGTISPETAAVIVNALYLKVAWLHAFDEAATTPADFHAPSCTRQVPTMRQQESFRYAADGGWRMLTLPTPSGVVVDVLLPDRDGVPAGGGGAAGGGAPAGGEPAAGAEPGLPAADQLAALQSAGRPTKVDLTLPRFRVEAAATLNTPLAQLGVVAAFDRGEADFSGMVDDGQVFIDLVAHKAVVRADEQGFEGAAATAVVMGVVSVDLSTPVPFHVDRPFLVLVRHPRTGAIYFVARVVEP